jgi:hypothetical protein
MASFRLNILSINLLNTQPLALTPQSALRQSPLEQKGHLLLSVRPFRRRYIDLVTGHVCYRLDDAFEAIPVLKLIPQLTRSFRYGKRMVWSRNLEHGLVLLQDLFGLRRIWVLVSMLHVFIAIEGEV